MALKKKRKKNFFLGGEPSMFNHLKLTIMTKYQIIAVTNEGVLLTSRWTRKAAAEQDFRRKMRVKFIYKYICLAQETWETGNKTLTNAIVIKEYMDLLNDKSQCKRE